MAIDSIFFTDTDKLAHSNKTFIPVKIPVSHWQLRHYISSPEKDTLYYASGTEVFHVNTATRKRKFLTSLPFDARCTASGYGYVCVGGEDEGHFAVIKLDNTRRQSNHGDVDTPLPMEDYWQATSLGPRAVNVKVERIGDEIVNSISIHQIHDEEAHLYDIVAVLTNNDRTVRVYSLQHGVETTCLELPFPMNHASISPDGHSMVAVGDSNQAFFYTRNQEQEAPQIPKPHNRLNMSAASWTLANVVHLRCEPMTRDAAQSPGYFTTAWSPSGQLVAVGSELGHITVFDMEMLEQCGEDEGEDAIVATVPSTRPNIAAHLHPGAVRTIVFSPEPWDLLIWAEDQGRICISDLRTGLRTKQVIELKPDDESLERVDLEDVLSDGSASLEEQSRLLDLEEVFLRRYRESSDSDAARNIAAEFVEARERLRQHQNLRRDFPSIAEANTAQDDPRGLTSREQQILESLRTTRQREEARSHGGLPRSVNYTTSSMFPPVNRSSSNTPTTDSRPFSDVLVNHNDPYAAFPELSRTSQRNPLPTTRETDRLGDDTLPPIHSIQEYLRDRARQPLSGTGAPSVNRRNVPPPPHAARTAVPSTSTPEPDEDSPEAPWRTISAAMNLARGPLFESPRSAEPALAHTTRPSQQQSNRTSQPLDAVTRAEQNTVTRTEQLRRIAAQRDRLRAIRREYEGDSSNSTLAYDNLRAFPPVRISAGGGFSDYAEVLLGRRAAGGRDVNIGVRTAGLAMSADGRLLWVATEEGIFEISVNCKGRMAFPAVELR